MAFPFSVQETRGQSLTSIPSTGLAQGARESSSDLFPRTSCPTDATSSPHQSPPNMAGLHDAVYDAAQPGHDAVVHLCGAAFQEHHSPAQYTPSVTTESSLPLSHHHRRCSMVADNIDRDYYSDTAESTGHNTEQADPGFLLTPESRNPRSMLPALQSIARWQQEQDDWTAAAPARSVAHAKRRHKDRVRRSLNKINAALPKSPGKSHTDGTKAKGGNQDNSSTQS